ncbi:hypothetical protein BDZ45DRAFT_145986 [Acephala macrosclerotiorum]|nr:hypothetical protein BDZ45DRAFT_145986 [Acephala macrosclerotiorum]
MRPWENVKLLSVQIAAIQKARSAHPPMPALLFKLQAESSRCHNTTPRPLPSSLLPSWPTSNRLSTGCRYLRDRSGGARWTGIPLEDARDGRPWPAWAQSILRLTKLPTVPSLESRLHSPPSPPVRVHYSAIPPQASSFCWYRFRAAPCDSFRFSVTPSSRPLSSS